MIDKEQHTAKVKMSNRIVQNFDGGNFDVFDAFHLDRQNLTRQNNTVFTGVWRKTVTIHQNIFCQIFEESVSVKISPRQNFALYCMSNTMFIGHPHI